MVRYLARLALPAALLYTAGVLLVLVTPAPQVHFTERSFLELDRLRQGDLPVRDTVQNIVMFLPSASSAPPPSAAAACGPSPRARW